MDELGRVFPRSQHPNAGNIHFFNYLGNAACVIPVGVGHDQVVDNDVRPAKVIFDVLDKFLSGRGVAGVNNVDQLLPIPLIPEGDRITAFRRVYLEKIDLVEVCHGAPPLQPKVYDILSFTALANILGDHPERCRRNCQLNIAEGAGQEAVDGWI
jgi:hypothetical protein